MRHAAGATNRAPAATKRPATSADAGTRLPPAADFGGLGADEQGWSTPEDRYSASLPK